ncbi:hypothetical protein LEY_8 [Paenibacillus phage Ley]|uniref:Uncharacterized protein n=3 Tax=Halcyonevirus C7Cdelta TaxID=2845733 RepID=A0A345ASG5_9CAUD|nr:hypothetical protein [Paenibacillus larvae]YP_010082175.1 hypothetical protein KMD17_gp08 [Paenibacillus phage C7Cdelta]AXF39935.1 hypothetical protein ASH_8 [Paenibacillus phage Ash]AXF40222.1 hypothetical protein LEY_8 [Paenibacillus phage Ley]AXF39769.1 hypothetical protein C7CDELTA_8 [Paenibacillus phage C7Cdelta]MDT2249282.1 hypothetical protein [Paenibacillus larvae]
MTVNINAADEYITANCIDVQDWLESDPERKKRLLTVSADTLSRRYPRLSIPDNAVYEFANVLSVKFNDTYRHASNGVQSYSVTGVATFSFYPMEKDVRQMVTQKVLDIISDENDVDLRLRRVGMGVR